MTVGQPVATISKNRRLQLRADVSENYFNELKKIREPTSWYPTITRFIGWKIFTGVYYPLAKPLLNLLSISRLLLSSIISVGFHSGSYVEVYLLTTPQNNVFSIPVTALTEEQGIYFVYLQIAEEEFVKREVGIGESDGKT